MPSTFKKLQKQSLGFAIIYIGKYMSVTQKENNSFKFMKTFTESQRLSDSFEDTVVKIRFIKF